MCMCMYVFVTSIHARDIAFVFLFGPGALDPGDDLTTNCLGTDSHADSSRQQHGLTPPTTTHTLASHGLRAQPRRHISRWHNNIIIFISEAASGQHQRKDAVDPSTERAARRQTRSATETTFTTRVWQSESHPEPSQESSSSRSLHSALKT